jgi:hypothetical protein
MSRSTICVVISLVICLSCGTADAQRIYVLSVGDTSEKGGLAFSTGPDLEYVFDAFYANVPGGQLVTYNNPMIDFADGSSGFLPNPWEGPDVRSDLVDMKDKILRAIDHCPAGQHDAIVIFYTGHGGYDDDGHFLVMPDGQNRLHRKTILDRIASRNPRLAVLITDTCNLHVPSGVRPGPAPMLIPPERISPLFDSLFIRSHGVVDINSSSEGEVAIGAIGGGLLTLSLAYMGNEPDFQTYAGFDRNPRSSWAALSDAIIPSVDHSMAVHEFFGQSFEHGMHGNFDPDGPSFGIMFANAHQNLTWEAVGRLLKAKIDRLFQTVAPNGWDTDEGRQVTQTPRFYSLPRSEGSGSQSLASGQAHTHSQQQGRWSRPTYRPEVGDRIIEINGRPIHNLADYVQAVKSSPAAMTFLLWDARTGKTFLMQTQLNPRNSNSRFGVGAEEAPGGGIRVKYVRQGYPGTRCQVLE